MSADQKPTTKFKMDLSDHGESHPFKQSQTVSEASVIDYMKYISIAYYEFLSL